MSYNEINLGVRRMVLLAPLTIGDAVAATATTPKTGLGGMKYLVVTGVFLYGSGGTDAIARVQTSIDGGLSWIDIASLGFLTAASKKVSVVTTQIAPAAQAAVYTDGSLAVNTIIQGVLGDRLRVKYVTTGNYADVTSLAVYAIAKG